MLPISDAGARAGRVPIVTVAIISLNILVFFYQLSLDARALDRSVLAYGVIPFEITSGRDLAPTIPLPIWTTLFTSMFMHGGWMHIIGNMLYLWIFGDNIEDALGHGVYFVFYLVCGLAAAGAQIFADPASTIPSIGASGAVAGVLGAYLLLYPTHRINSLIFLGYFVRVVQLPAVLVLGFWIVLQLFSGISAAGAQTDVAYWAHVGGFVAGMALILPVFIMQRRRASRRSYER